MAVASPACGERTDHATDTSTIPVTMAITQA
ncbi:Uncharacterised protein [Mycobacteroides abscessus subsp. massiliense]|nr:Uncharacterised protein [Mycobacteroides abscessus subsp. massiliense]